MQKKQSGFSIIEILLVILWVGIFFGTGWYLWELRSSDQQSSKETTSSQTPNTNQQIATFDSLPSSESTSNLNYSDNAGVFSLQYPSAWKQTETPLPSGGIGTSANKVAFLFTSPAAPMLSASAPAALNGVSVVADLGISDINQSIVDFYGYESPGKKYIPEKITVNGKKAYYLKIIKESYTDHSVIITDGDKAVSVGFREKQNGSLLGSGTTSFDSSGDLPEFKAIVSSVTFL